MSDSPEDVGEEVQVTTRKVSSKKKREVELIELKEMLSTYAGRAFMWRLLSQCGVYRTSFTGNSTTFFNEGKRQIGLWALDEVMEADKQAFYAMQSEAVERGERK